MPFGPVRFKSGILMKKGIGNLAGRSAAGYPPFLTHYIMLLIRPRAISHHAPADSGLIKTNASTPLTPNYRERLYDKR